MYLDAKTQKEKMQAALDLLLEDTTSFEKFEKVRILLKGLNPKIDKLLNTGSHALKNLKNLQEGDVIELTAENLPQNTKEQKKRKKFLLLFISSWKDLRGEVARLQELHKDQSQDQLVKAGKVAAKAKGPFGLITALALIIPSGGQTVASVPPLSAKVDGTKDGVVLVSAYNFNMEYRLGGNNAQAIFNGMSLMGKTTNINLSSVKSHELIIKCL